MLHATKATLIASLFITTAAFAQGDDKTGKFETLDLNKDGAVTLAEMENHRQQNFKTIDRNGDQTLSQGELATQRTQKRQEWLQKVFERKDSNKDNLLSESELSNRRGKRLMSFDKNNDKMLSLDEIKQGFAAKHQERLPKMFARMDQNKDQKIDLTEFSAKLSERFEKMDQNKDGKITQDEMKSRGWRHKRHGSDHDTPSAG